ncbi:hypothetical protein D3C80_1952410 [compost metagenome]
MSSRVDVNTGPEQAVITDSHFADIEYSTIKVGVEMFPNMDIVAIVNPNVGFHAKVLTK